MLIAVIAFLSYCNSFDVPFCFDDYLNIVDNSAIKDLGHFLDPPKTKHIIESKSDMVFTTFKSRLVPYFTFALNYRFNGLSVGGYHAFNFAVHLANGILVYMLILSIFSAPRLRESVLSRSAMSVALFTALVFVSHPVQTQAVTYITQRFASIAAFFYILSVLLYARWRIASANERGWRNRRSIFVYLLCVLSAALAMKTKENAITLPIAVATLEFMFFDGRARRRVMGLLPLFALLPIIPLSLMDLDRPFWEAVSIATRTQYEVTRLEYVLTQFRVGITYFRLLFMPVNLNLDYDYNIYDTFSNPQVFISLIFHLEVLAITAYLFLRSRRGDPGLRLLVFGIAWFYITLAVESGPVALGNMIFEHRLYLPAVGMFAAFFGGLFLFIEKSGSASARRIAVSCLVTLVLALTYASFSRNMVWSTEMRLWEDVVSKSPAKPESRRALGDAYRMAGMPEKAIEQYKIAISLKPRYVEALNNLGSVYLESGMTENAIRYFMMVLDLSPKDPFAHHNLGVAYHDRGFIERAIMFYKAALQYKPCFADGHRNLGRSYYTKGMVDEAIASYVTAIRLNPEDYQTYFDLGLVYFEKGQMAEARESLREALLLRPDMVKARWLIKYINSVEGRVKG